MTDPAPIGRAWQRQRRTALPLLLFAVLTLGATHAQDGDRLYLDHTEWDYEELGVTTPIVHLYDAPALEECLNQEDPNACAAEISHRLPFVPASSAEAAAEELATAYGQLRRAVAREVDAKINASLLEGRPPCHTTMICTPFGIIGIPTPIPSCLLPRTIEGITEGLADHLPTYYAEVERIVTTHLASFVRSGTIYPLVDSIVAPTMDLSGSLSALLTDLESVSDFDDAISRAYRMQSLNAFLSGGQIAPSIPHLANQIEYEARAGRSLALPGIYGYEEDKRAREQLYDPNSVESGGSLWDGVTSMLPGVVSTDIGGTIVDTVAGDLAAGFTEGMADEVNGILTDFLPDEISPDVVGILTDRVMTTIGNASEGEDLAASIGRTLTNGMHLLMPDFTSNEDLMGEFIEGTDWASLNPDLANPGARDTPATEVTREDGTLTISNPFLYEHLGYAGFTQITPFAHESILLHWDGLIPFPGITLWCGVFPAAFPTFIKIPWPTPAVIPGVARTEYVTVPEGYPVPSTGQDLTVSPIRHLFE